MKPPLTVASGERPAYSPDSSLVARMDGPSMQDGKGNEETKAAGPLRGWPLARFAKSLAAAVLGAALAGLATGPAHAQPDGFQPRCLVATIDTVPHAICETGPVAGGRVLHARYEKEGTTGWAEANFVSFTTVGKVSAVLGVVDRGDRRRQRTVGLASADLARLIEAARAAGPSNRFGLGQISDRFESLAPIGASREDIARVTGAIRADGPLGDPGRIVLDAIRHLTLAQAERHILVIASDGKTDDRGYGRDDVIRAAREAKVSVVTVAYRDRPEVAGPEVASLKRLADEIGGLHLDAVGATGRIDDAAVARFAQFVGSGGTATFPLSRNEPRGRYLLTLEFEGGRTLTGTFFADAAPVAPQTGQPARPAAGLQPAGNTPAGQAQPPTPSGPRSSNPQPSGDDTAFVERSGLDNLVDWIADEWRDRSAMLIAIPAVLLVLAAAAGWFQIRRRKRRKVFAWLELSDSSRVPLAASGVRLGRHPDNDVRFTDQSVHSHHAVLHRDATTGRFVISDVSRDQQRSNGVLVNGEPIEKIALGDGDLIELGAVKLRLLYA